MIALLRLVGIGNAALWFGSTVFVTLAVGPSFFSDLMAVFGWPKTGLLAKYYAGTVAQMVIERYFIVHYWCGAIALTHLVAGWFYGGRALQRWSLYWVLALLSLGLAGGFWVQPKLHQLHRTMYGWARGATPAQVEQARKSFGTWHGIAQMANLAMLAGLAVHLWQVTQPTGPARFTGRTKFGLG